MTSLTIHFVVLILAFVQHIKAYTVLSSGGSGDVCGPIKCLSGKAACVHDECQCNKKRYSSGKGRLNCYKKSEFWTAVTNDPRIRTYNGNSFEMSIPCRYLLTHVVTDYKNRRRRVKGSCEFLIHTFHAKDRGKFFVHGFDVAIRIECNNGTRLEMTIRKSGIAYKGSYDFTIQGTDKQFLPDGPWGNDVIYYYDKRTKLRIKCRVDKRNNLAEIIIKKCGMRINFRPYDVKLQRETQQIPGMTVAVSVAFNPVFESVDKVISLPPKSSRVHNGFNIRSILIPGLGPLETMMLRAYMSDIYQPTNPACSEARYSFLKCNHFELQAAFANCLWILKSPRFIRCYDETTTGEDIQELFNRCVDVYCDNLSCNLVMAMIGGRRCQTVPGYPMLNSFMAGAACP